MSNGYVILAFTAQEQKAASACAYSIKIQNPNAHVSMIIDSLDNANDAYEEPFDNIIELPFDVVSDIRANDWQLKYVSPYDNTIAIDCYSLVKEKHDNLWAIFIIMKCVLVLRQWISRLIFLMMYQNGMNHII